MTCQTRLYNSATDGFESLFYAGESISSSICDVTQQFKGISLGGSRKRRKSRKYTKYTNATKRYRIRRKQKNKKHNHYSK
jgi:hypothetical protein